MNILRRRAGDSSRQPAQDTPDEANDYRVGPPKELQGNAKSHHNKGSKRWTAWIFVLGGVFGIMVAVFFVGRNEMLDFAGLHDLSLDSILDVLPAGMMREAKQFEVRQLVCVVSLVTTADAFE